MPSVTFHIKTASDPETFVDLTLERGSQADGIHYCTLTGDARTKTIHQSADNEACKASYDYWKAHYEARAIAEGWA